MDDLDGDIKEISRKLRKRKEVLGFYRTISGQGFRVLFRCIVVPKNDAEYKQYWEQGKEFLLSIGLKVDENTKDISRASYVCYDPDAYLNQDAKPLRLGAATTKESKGIDLEDLPELLEYVDADSYERWTQTIWAVNREFGDESVEIVREWSKTSDKHTDLEFEKVWGQTPEPSKKPVTMGSVVQWAKEGGWKPPAKSVTKSEEEAEKDAEEKAKTAARVQKHKNLREQKYREWVKTKPQHLHAPLMDNWGEGAEAAGILQYKAASKHLLYVNGQGLKIRDKKGLWHDTETKTGKQFFVGLMRAYRKLLLKELEKLNEPEKIRPTIWRRLNVDEISDRRVKEVVASVATIADLLPANQIIESYDTNQKRVIQFNNGIYDLRDRRMLTEKEVKSGFLNYHEKQGAASPDIWVKLGDPHISEVRDTIAHYGDLPFRYYLHLIRAAGKEAGIIYAQTSDAGKTILAEIWRQGIGVVEIISGSVVVAAGSFDVLEIAMSKNLLVIVEEADKLSSKFKIGKLNEAISGGVVTVNPKMEKMQTVQKIGTVLFTTAGGININWDAQGILPVEDEQGKRSGGRFKGLVNLPEFPLDGRLGAFWGCSRTTRRAEISIERTFFVGLSVARMG